MTISKVIGTVARVYISKCNEVVHVQFEDREADRDTVRDSVALVIRDGVAGFSLVQNLQAGDRVLEFKDNSERGLV